MTASRLPSSDRALHLRAGAAAHAGYDAVITPESAGWDHTGLRVVTLGAEAARSLDTSGVETIVVPLQGAAELNIESTRISLTGRVNVFAGAPDVAYLPPNNPATLSTARGGRFALCTARTNDASRPARRVAAANIPIERRGAGPASRLIRNLATAETLDAAAVIVCEVVTPAGNWSSYPAHKHDEAGPHESRLEEIYYFEIGNGPRGEPGFGFHRTSASAGHQIDVLVEVHNGDVALVPFGWHGPCVAAPGHDMYYLNVMAGPGPGRHWRITDHPEQAWVRDTWTTTPIDSRLADGYYGA